MVAAAPGETTQLAEAKRQYRAFVSARLLLVALFIGLWLLVWPMGYQMPYGFLIVLIAELLAMAGFLKISPRLGRPELVHRMHYALLAMELVCHTFMFYFLGGISWLGAIAYIYALMYAAVFLTRWQAALFTGLVAGAYLLVVSLDAAGVVPHQWYLPQGPERFREEAYLVTTSVAFVGVLATITFWMVFIGGELRRERDVALRANAQILRTQAELENLNEELERKVADRTRALAWRAEHDQLTALLNRGSATRRFHELLALARRGGRPLCIVIADADNFKRCNDTGGHAYGDEVLKEIGLCLRTVSRESDVIGRVGGDEFLVVLPDTALAGGIQYCERLLAHIEERRRKWVLDGLVCPTLSLGLAVFPDHGSDVEELMRVADRAMYDAKASGGARVIVGRPGAGFGDDAPGGDNVRSGGPRTARSRAGASLPQ